MVASIARPPLRGRRPPAAIIAALLLVGALVAWPLGGALLDAFGGEGRVAWAELLTSPLGWPVLGRPLLATLGVGLAAALLATAMGACLAIAVTITDLPARRLFAIIATLPLMMPGFATAFAWTTLFANERVGANLGLLAAQGVAVPDWLAWGAVPTIVVLGFHYYALVFGIVSAALVRLDGSAVEAARVAGASTADIIVKIVLPMVRPALIGGFMLAFAASASNFAVPAILGLPVRFQTLSTRLFGLLETGQTARALVLAVVLLAAAALLVWAADRARGEPASARGAALPANLPLASARTPVAAFLWMLVLTIAIAPIAVLVASSLSANPALAFRSFDLAAWTGPDGVLANEALAAALMTTAKLGLIVAAFTTLAGFFVASAIESNRGSVSGRLLAQASFVPLLVPDIVFATAYIAAFAGPVGPIPPLYGTFTLLVLAMSAHVLPYSVETARAVLGQIDPKLDEAARLAGAGPIRRMTTIIAPLALPGLTAGALMVLVKTVRDIALVVVLFTPATATLSILAFRYGGEGFLAQANAITLLIFALAAAATLVAHQLAPGRMERS